VLLVTLEPTEILEMQVLLVVQVKQVDLVLQVHQAFQMSQQ
jgi:hypothetical protein